MAWDATTTALTIKAIGTVESNFDYGAINPSDAITLGVAQWYGTRAANLLFRIKTEGTGGFDLYCPDTIKSAMLSHPANDAWWNSRHVTREEVAGLRTMLTRTTAKMIQNDQFSEDIDGYLDVAENWGLNKTTETLTTAFFCTIYHQSPRAASQICANLPELSTLENIYQAALNNDIVGDYRTRQDTAYEIIKTGDTTGVTTPGDDDVLPDPPDGGDGGDDGGGGGRRRTKAHHIVKQGNVLVLHTKGGDTVTFYKSGGVYLPASSGGIGTAYEGDSGDNGGDDGETPPVPTNPSAPKGTAADIIAFARSKLLDFSYSQGPGRMTPELSGYTDCSAFLVYAFQKGGNISLGGTYTGNLCTRGTLVKDGAPTEAEMNPGDLIFLRWGSAVRSNSPFDHVEMYCGGGTRISMGRTPGPTEAAWNVDINVAISNGGRVQIRRYL